MHTFNVNVFVRIYLYTYICTRAHMYINTPLGNPDPHHATSRPSELNMYTYMHIFLCTYIYMHISICTCVCTRAYTYMHTPLGKTDPCHATSRPSESHLQPPPLLSSTPLHAGSPSECPSKCRAR